MIEAIKEVLKGIDQTELESTDGWWETSAGAEFGAKKLKYILGLLAQPEQEPVANVVLRDGLPTLLANGQIKPTDERLYTNPPQRTWVGLTDEEIRKAKHHMVEGAYDYSFKQGAEWAETKLKEKTHDMG